MEKVKWRLIIDEAHEGAYNMAFDEALLLSAATKHTPPTLRLYSWDPATLSLGFAQPSADVDRERLQKQGWGLVRRPTGGRAILHTDELTYSLTAPQDDPYLSGSLLESYRKISVALLAALRRLNIEANGDKHYGDAPTTGHQNPVCFESPSNYEITAQGKKLIGSAQARKHGGILQHGSLPLYGDITRITWALKYDNENERARAANQVVSRAITTASVLPVPPSWHTATQAFVEGFMESFDIVLLESKPTEEEAKTAAQLFTSKYASDAWTFRI
jgi:lipoate-protein ligase A